jgi:hypothetical protein
MIYSRAQIESTIEFNMQTKLIQNQIKTSVTKYLEDDVIKYSVLPYVSNFFDLIEVTIEASCAFEVYKGMYYTVRERELTFEESRDVIIDLCEENRQLAREDELYRRYTFEVGTWCKLKFKDSRYFDYNKFSQVIREHYDTVEQEGCSYKFRLQPLSISRLEPFCKTNYYEWYSFFPITTEDQFEAFKTEEYRLELVVYQNEGQVEEVLDYWFL